MKGCVYISMDNKIKNINHVVSLGNAPGNIFVNATPKLVEIENENEITVYRDASKKLDEEINKVKDNPNKSERITDDFNKLYKEFGEQNENLVSLGMSNELIYKNVFKGVSIKLLDMDRNHIVSIVDDNGNKHPWFIAPLTAIFEMPERNKQFFKNFTIVEMLAREKGTNTFTIENKDVYRYYQATTETKMKKEQIRKNFVKDLELFRNIKFVMDDINYHGKVFRLKNQYFLSMVKISKEKRTYRITIDEEYYNLQKEKGTYTIDKKILSKDVKTSMFMLYCTILNIIESMKDETNFNFKFNKNQLRELSFYRTDEDIQENTSGKGVHGASKEYWKNEFETDLKALGRDKKYSLLISEPNQDDELTIYNAINEDEKEALKHFDDYCKINKTKNPY